MPSLAVQRFIHRNLVQREKINQFLNWFGLSLNRLGLPYATGLTRHKASLFVTHDPASRKELLSSGKSRAKWAVYDHDTGGRTALEKFYHFWLSTEVGNAQLEALITELSRRGIEVPKNTIAAGLSAGLSSTQIFDLFGMIADKCENGTRAAFKSLPAAFEAAEQALSPDQIADLFGRIVEKFKYESFESFESVPVPLQEAKKILTPDQIFDLFGKIIDTSGRTPKVDFEYLPAALKAAGQMFTPDQIFDLFERIVEKCGIMRFIVFKYLPAALQEAKLTLTPDQIFNLFGRIVEKSRSGYSFDTLPAALQEAKLTLTPDQIFDLFGSMVDKCGVNFYKALETLPIALQANLTPGQIVDLFGIIVKRCNNHEWANVVLAYLQKALPAARQTLSPDQIVDLFGWIGDRFKDEASEIFEIMPGILQEARLKLPPDQIISFFKEMCKISKLAEFKGEDTLSSVVLLLKENISQENIISFMRSHVISDTSDSSLLDLLKDSSSLFPVIKALYLRRTGRYANFSGKWLTLKMVAYLLNKISKGHADSVRQALRLFLKHEISPTYEALREMVEFQDNYPFIEQALRSDPAFKNNYSNTLREEVKLDFIYYQTNGYYKKAEMLTRLLIKNRSEEKIRAAMTALRFVEEEKINLRKIKSLSRLKNLVSKANAEYKRRVERLNFLAQRILDSQGNRDYVETILRNLGYKVNLENVSASDLLNIIANIRGQILRQNVMLRVDAVYNKAISELSCTQGIYQTEAATFYEAWLAEMDMATALQKEIISVQNQTGKPLLVILNERTAPTYFGRDSLPKSYTQRFGIVQNINDEEVLNILGQVDCSDETLRQLGQKVFAAGSIYALSGFKIASSHNDIDDQTLGVYIKNINRLMELKGGNAAFVDMSRRRIGGATSFLYKYLNTRELADIHPRGKLLETGDNVFDGTRRRHGLRKLQRSKTVAWHLLDPCKIEEYMFKDIAGNEYETLRQELSPFIGGNKPFADDRRYAFYSMPSSNFGSPGEGIAPRFQKENEAWCIPDLERGLVPIHEYMAQITARVVPERINGSLDEIIPYHRFSPYLIRRLDTLFRELSIEDNILKKRFYGSDCFGYYLRRIPQENKEALIQQLNQAFEEQGLEVVATDAGETIDILQKGVNKGKAVTHFSKITGIAEEEVVRIGDQPLGNDREMLSHGRAYNVGQGTNIEGINNTTAKGPEGVLEALDEIEKEGFEGIVFDIDGTIDSDQRIHHRIINYLETGKKVAVATGRGESIRRKFIRKIEELGLSFSAKQNLSIYLYNGALCMR